MWSDPNRTQLDSHLPCCTGRTSTLLSEFQPQMTLLQAGNPLWGPMCAVSFCHDFSPSILVILTLSPPLVKTCDVFDVVKAGLGGNSEAERAGEMKLSCHRSSWCVGSPTPRAHRSYLFTRQTLHAALIRALLWWVSVGKHLFSRHALLHLPVVTASACKQGDANCLSPSFYGTQEEQTNKSGNFTQQPVKHSHSAHGDKCNQVPSAVIQARTHGNMPTWKQMCAISHTCHRWGSLLHMWHECRASRRISHRFCGTIKVATAHFGLVLKDCLGQ